MRSTLSISHAFSGGRVVRAPLASGSGGRLGVLVIIRLSAIELLFFEHVAHLLHRMAVLSLLLRRLAHHEMRFFLVADHVRRITKGEQHREQS